MFIKIEYNTYFCIFTEIDAADVTGLLSCLAGLQRIFGSHCLISSFNVVL